ncbi:MAG TPA: EthD family reductase [Candidatus Baltobacteraceae bacterium]
MAVKLTVVYDNPTDPETFEKHYHSVHVPLAQKIPNVKRVELAKVFPKEDGSPTPAYRTADVYFESYADACAAIASPEGQGAIKDALAIGTGGVRFLLSDIEVST